MLTMQKISHFRKSSRELKHVYNGKSVQNRRDKRKQSPDTCETLKTMILEQTQVMKWLLQRRLFVIQIKELVFSINSAMNLQKAI